MIKAAIFDMDGTLTDTERLYREYWTILAEEFGQIPDPEFPQAVCGSNGENMLNIIRKHYPAIDAEVFMNACYARVQSLLQTHVPLKEGAIELLDYFRKKQIRLAVASSNYHEQIAHNLKVAGILEYFDALVGGDEVECSKPNPDIYIEAARRLSCKPEECFAIEDGMNGLEAGISAGCATVMIVDMTEPDDVLAPKCYGVYDDFLEFRDDIEKKNFKTRSRVLAPDSGQLC